MAKILCSKSSIEFNCEHFPISLTQGEMHHPIFNVPLKRLWKYLPKWQNDELTETDNYLLFLALLNATEMVEFQTAAIRTPQTASIVQSNMETLYDIIGKVITIRHPRFVLPRLCISMDTRNLGNVKQWIAVWQNCYDSFRNGLKDDDIRTRLRRKEASLERLIKNPAIRPEKYAHILAQWASEAGQFPEFEINLRDGVTTCSEYWQDIIQRCYRAESIITVPEKDIIELLEHCEEHIELGSIFSYQLFTILKEGLDSHRGFFGIGITSFSIIGKDDSVEQANLSLLLESAPVSEPRRIDYPSEFAYMKAKMKWSLVSASQLATSSQSDNADNTKCEGK